MIFILKRIISKLPVFLQIEIKRFYYLFQILLGKFITSEPEFSILHEYIHDGDWVIDIGANVGHYTKRLSELVGNQGRVIAFEPISDTFELLTLNIHATKMTNVTLINTAVSSKTIVANMTMPLFETGLISYTQARIIDSSENSVQVIALSLDSLNIRNRISFVKIDVEGHEKGVLEGMRFILQRDKPTMIIETDSEDIVNYLVSAGYTHKRLPRSPNIIFWHENNQQFKTENKFEDTSEKLTGG